MECFDKSAKLFVCIFMFLIFIFLLTKTKITVSFKIYSNGFSHISQTIDKYLLILI